MTRIRQYEMTPGEWTSQNIVLLVGEIGWESGVTTKAKKGDGTTAWNDLPYWIDGPLSTKAPLDSPAFTGNPTAPTPTAGDSDTSIATTAFVQEAVASIDVSGFAPKADPVFTGNPKTPTPAPGDNDTSIANTAFVKAAITAAVPAEIADAISAAIAASKLASNPVGTIKMTVVNTNPGTYLGGTWSAWGSGRVPVGVDGGQSEFNTVEETGGEKTHVLTEAELATHSHIVPTFLTDTGAGANSVQRVTVAPGDITANSAGSTSTTGSNTAHNNLQPYITCYMWKRTA